MKSAEMCYAGPCPRKESLMEQPKSTQQDDSPEAEFRRFCETGAPDAMGRVFDALAPGLLLLSGHLGADAHGAEDFVQQTFIAALERKEHWDPSRPLFPWFAGILTHKVRHGQRQETRRRGSSLEADAWVDGAAPPHQVAMAIETHQQVTEAISALKAPYRELLVLHLVHGLQAHEIAHALGRSPGTVRMQLMRGKEQLRGQLPNELHSGLGAVAATALGLDQIRASVLSQVHASTGAAAKGWSMSIALGVVATLMAVSLSGFLWALPQRTLGSALPRQSTAPTFPAAEVAVLALDSGRATVARVSGAMERAGTAPSGALDTFPIRVLREDGSPVNGATVWREPLASAEQSSWIAERLGTTDANGDLVPDTGVKLGDWRLWATTEEGDRTWATEIRRAPPGAAAPPKAATLTLPHVADAIWLRGRVVDPATNEPIESVRLALECDGAFAPTWSAPDGRFKLGPISPDTDLRTATGPLLVARCSGLGARMAPWRRLTSRITATADDEAEWAPLYMDAAVLWRGRVVFQDGTPVPGATVQIPRSGGKTGAAIRTQTSEDGKFSINLPTRERQTIVQARYPGFFDCGVGIPASSEVDAKRTVELRFDENPGPRLVLHGFDGSGTSGGNSEGPYTVSVIRDGLYFSAPLWRGTAYLPPADALPSGSWGRALVAVSGSAWGHLAEVRHAIIKDTGSTELTPTRFKTGSVMVHSAEPAERFEEGREDFLSLQIIPSTSTAANDGWPKTPASGVNLTKAVTLLQNVRVGTYEASDSIGRSVQVEVREGEVTEVRFPER